MSWRFQVLTNILPCLFLHALCELCGENALALVVVFFRLKAVLHFKLLLSLTRHYLLVSIHCFSSVNSVVILNETPCAKRLRP